jgi:hypothetical protein
MAFIEDILERPAKLGLASNYITLVGLLDLGGGLLLTAWPGIVQTVLADAAFVGHEEGLIRMFGVVLIIIGFLGLAGGRSGSRAVVAVNAPTRVVLVPAVFLPLAMAGVFPHLLITLTIFDFLMGIGAWVLLTRSVRS